MSDTPETDIIDDIPVETEELETEEAEEVDDCELQATSAKSEYRLRMEALGAEFADDGTFIRFKSDGVVNNAPVADEWGNVDEIAQLRQELMAETKPTKINSFVQSVIATNPKLARYEGQVKQLLNAVDATLINEKVVESYFYWARGQAADLEVVEAVKSDRAKRSGNILAGSVAMSESAGGRPITAGKNAIITPEVLKFAKEIGVDPQKLANKYTALKNAKK